MVWAINVLVLNSVFWWSLFIAIAGIIMSILTIGVAVANNNGFIFVFSPLFSIASYLAGWTFVITGLIKLLIAIGILVV